MRRYHEDINRMKSRRILAKQNGSSKTELGRFRKCTPLGCPVGKKCKICNYDQKREPTQQELKSELELKECEFYA